ncbi:MAG TPA: signal peptide peptidase SppA [Kofleriaceae bacterium]|nr:signal peptide peptidase SppA [Kofleriaceae bacterium]
MVWLGVWLRLLVAVAVAAAAARPAGAQPNFVPRDLTRGVSLPGGGGAAGDFDATAVTRNPAGLATLGGASAAFVGTMIDREDTVRGGGGWGLYIGLPFSLDLPGGETLTASYGFGFESLASPDSWVGPFAGLEHPQDGSFLRNGLAFGTRMVTVGWMLGTFFWNSSPQRDSISTHHFGISVRPSRFAALGLHMRDVFQPVGRVPEEKFARSYEADVLARPLGDWRLEVGGGAVVGEDDLVDASARLLLRPLRGVAVYGEFQSVERRFGAIDAGTSRDSRLMVGVTLDGLEGLLGGRGLSVSAGYGLLTSSKSASAYAGSSILARFSREHYPALREPEQIERFVIDQPGSERELIGLLLGLERASRATDVTGVLLDLRGGGWQWGAADDLRGAIARLRRSGVPVTAYVREGDMRSIYLAAACDRVYLHPSAAVSLAGIGAQLVFVGDLLTRLGVGVQVVQIGDYKSFGETFTRTSASQASREQLRALFGDFEARFRSEVARGRHMAPARLQALLDRPSVSAREALAAGLVDGILHPDEIEGALERALGRKVTIRRAESVRRHPLQWAYPRIAVIYVSGDIVAGAAPSLLFGDTAAGDEVADAIREAREAGDVRAIILRVDSPGGLIEPSERIAREVELTRGKKPILVSMGDVAASGGYMVSAGADRVFAQPTTVTGSIGVVSVKVNLRDVFARIGVTGETVQTGAHADAGSLFRPWADDELAAVRVEMTDAYRRFVELVARGRRLPAATVTQLAGGRVWSGSAAQRAGLVDQEGGFLDALELARREAGLSPRVEVEVVDRPVLAGNLLQRVFAPRPAAGSGLGAGGPALALSPLLSRIARALPACLWWGGGALARMPFAAPL